MPFVVIKPFIHTVILIAEIVSIRIILSIIITYYFCNIIRSVINILALTISFHISVS